MRFPGFVGPTYQLQSVNIDAQRCINWIPQQLEMPGKDGEQYAFFDAPGTALLAAIGAGPWRGLWWSSAKQTLYGVSGNTLYQINSDWTSTSLGTLNTSTGMVSMVDDGFNLVIVDGANGYDYNFTGSAFTQITDAGFLGSDVVFLMDNFFIFNQPNSRTFYTSDLPSSNPSSPISFPSPVAEAQKEGASDNIISLIATHQNLWLFGELTTEVWYDAGNPTGMPFGQIQGAFIEYGCAAKFSPAKFANTLVWLGRDGDGKGMVVQANGYVPQRISTHAVEQAIQGYSDISDAVSWTYQQDGHSFYVLNFPTGNASWAYDVTTGLWHERAYLNNGVYERHRGICHADAYGVHVIGDYANSNLYQLSSSLKSDNGNPLPRRRRGPHVSGNDRRIFHNSLQVDFETGVGLDGTGQGTDPQVMLRMSNDAGHTWGSEIWTSLGKIGNTRSRVKWNRLGSARDRVYEITITDPVKASLIGAEIDLEQGAS